MSEERDRHLLSQAFPPPANALNRFDVSEIIAERSAAQRQLARGSRCPVLAEYVAQLSAAIKRAIAARLEA